MSVPTRAELLNSGVGGGDFFPPRYTWQRGRVVSSQLGVVPLAWGGPSNAAKIPQSPDSPQDGERFGLKYQQS